MSVPPPGEPVATGDSSLAEHPTIDDLADASEGLLTPSRQAEVQAHVDGCTECAASVQALSEVTTLLASERTPGMPDSVFASLAAVVETESAHRVAASRRAAVRPADVFDPRPTLGAFEAQRPSRLRRYAVPALLALAAAAAAGFGGYLVSAVSGQGEPTANAPTAISTDGLKAEAKAIRDGRDLDVHPFSQAWSCARDVTDGRITGITPVTVAGEPALLVYTRQSGETVATVVTGCSTNPVAGPSATLG